MSPSFDPGSVRLHGLENPRKRSFTLRFGRFGPRKRSLGRRVKSQRGAGSWKLCDKARRNVTLRKANTLSLLWQNSRCVAHPHCAMQSRLAQREAIRDNEKTDAPSLPLLAIRGHLCFRCLKKTDTLCKCGGCGRAAYCSVPCQIADWHVAHKHHCKAFQEVNSVERGEHGDKTWEEYTAALVRVTIRAPVTDSSCYLSTCLSRLQWL